MMPRTSLLALVIVALSGAPSARTQQPDAAPPAIDGGRFRLLLDDRNASLPASLAWRGSELLDAERGLGWSFTSFECRSKIYREENRHVWAGKDEPRFATDVGAVTTDVARADGATTARSTYANSFATIERRIVLHDAEPRLRIEYDFRFTRRVVIHEPDMFRLAVGFAPALAAETVADVRQTPPARFTRTCRDAQGNPTGARFEMSLLPAGPMLVQTTDGSLALVVTGGVSGDVPAGVPPKPLVFEPDARLTFTIEVRVAADAADATAAWDAAVRDMPATRKPATLLRLGDALAAEKDIVAAEAAYLEAARLDATFATPYGRLAGLRRDHPDVPGAITQGEAWIEGAYRQPYDFGFILSGNGLAADERLSEAERRLAIFNILIAMENHQFNADFYCWAARPFEALGMHAQACANYRQALWAADHMPRSEAQREKHRALCRAKIAELEAKLVGRTVEALPPLIPVRVPRNAPPDRK